MAGTAEAPKVWILWRRRKGDLDQMLTLVRALGWPFVVKRLDFAAPEVPLLAPLLLRRSSDDLSPPWPDVAICAEAMPSIIARRLRQRSGGRVRTVCLARPAGTADAFDLVITTAQYRLPPAPNVLELALPLGEAAPPPPRNDAGGIPRIAVAVGGSSFPDRLDAAAARDLAAALKAHAGRRGAVLDVITSPRTDQAAVAALQAAIAPPHGLHLFTAGPGNSYARLIAGAQEIVVTSDSVSMAADALATGKPVSIYRLPQVRRLQWHAAEWLYRAAVGERRWWLRPVAWAFDAGLLESTADRHLLFDRLARDGRLAWFGDPPPSPPPQAENRDLALAVARVKALVGAGQAPALSSTR